MSCLDLARGRYSCRSFEDRPVEQAVVDAIVEAGRIAPSACNNHPSRVMVLDTPELLEKAAACGRPRFTFERLCKAAGVRKQTVAGPSPPGHVPPINCSS